MTLERRTVLPARMDAVLFPLLPGETAYPTVTRLRADAQVTAFRIQGAGVDDTFILCEEGAGPVTVDGITFEGRALLVRRELTSSDRTSLSCEWRQWVSRRQMPLSDNPKSW